jgi:hypothetical protein
LHAHHSTHGPPHKQLFWVDKNTKSPSFNLGLVAHQLFTMQI